MRRMFSRIAACAGALLILFGGPVTGAESPGVPDAGATAAPAQKPFVFRNGIIWGMNPQQAALIENTPMELRSQMDWSVMVTDSPVTVSRFSATLVYLFYQNALRMITYEFQDNCSALGFQYLAGALSSVYGESQDASPVIVKSWMDRVYTNKYQLEQIRDVKEWTAEDGTHIYLFYFSAENYAILYVCPETAGGGTGFDTNGL